MAKHTVKYYDIKLKISCDFLHMYCIEIENMSYHHRYSWMKLGAGSQRDLAYYVRGQDQTKITRFYSSVGKRRNQPDKTETESNEGYYDIYANNKSEMKKMALSQPVEMHRAEASSKLFSFSMLKNSTGNALQEQCAENEDCITTSSIYVQGIQKGESVVLEEASDQNLSIAGAIDKFTPCSAPAEDRLSIGSTQRPTLRKLPPSFQSSAAGLKYHIDAAKTRDISPINGSSTKLMDEPLSEKGIVVEHKTPRRPRRTYQKRKNSCEIPQAQSSLEQDNTCLDQPTSTVESRKSADPPAVVVESGKSADPPTIIGHQPLQNVAGKRKRKTHFAESALATDEISETRTTHQHVTRRFSKRKPVMCVESQKNEDAYPDAADEVSWKIVKLGENSHMSVETSSGLGYHVKLSDIEDQLSTMQGKVFIHEANVAHTLYELDGKKCYREEHGIKNSGVKIRIYFKLNTRPSGSAPQHDGSNTCMLKAPAAFLLMMSCMDHQMIFGGKKEFERHSFRLAVGSQPSGSC